MLNRKKDSHKGQNGKVMIIGGNHMFHGAPILCTLGAEFSGADLVFPFIPPVHADALKNHSLNCIIQTFHENILTSKDVKRIVHFSKNVDSVVIGPGLGSDAKTKRAIKTLLTHLKIPTIIDASALFYTNTFPKTAILTPHQGEFHELTGDEPTTKNVQKWAKHFKVTIVCKGHEDIIANSDNIAINKNGNALMTVGGTGDVLSGLIGGLVAQGIEPFEAGKIATKALGQAGDHLANINGTLRAIDLVHEIPALLK